MEAAKEYADSAQKSSAKRYAIFLNNLEVSKDMIMVGALVELDDRITHSSLGAHVF